MVKVAEFTIGTVGTAALWEEAASFTGALKVPN
jgi:hypothetical protein